MKVKDMIEAQWKYEEHKKHFEAMKVFRNNFDDLYHAKDLYDMDQKTGDIMHEFVCQLERDIDRLKKQLNEMEA